MPRASSYRLTEQLIASHAGTSVLCLADAGIGRRYTLHAKRPNAALNMRAHARGGGAVEWRTDLPIEAFPVQQGGVNTPIEPVPTLVRVDIMGPIAQRAGFVQEDMCAGGYLDGNDAIADRLVAAFETGDVALFGDTPGGDPTGVREGIARALAAKERYGRRCTGLALHLIASLGMWWMTPICDEIFVTSLGQIGSIGARSGHKSIAGALDKAGEVVTLFADPPDKVALAPERPLSDVGRFRGERDTHIIGDAFRADVCASPLGLRSGLTPEYLEQLGADCLTGQAAVEAGLADGVSTEDEVTAYALAMAASGAKKNGSAQTRARGASMGTIRAEGDEDARARAEDDKGPPSSERPGGDEGEDAKGRDIPTKCAACGVENPKAAKFCMGCSASMGTAPMEDKPAAAAPRMRSSASFAEILGLSTDASLPTQKTALLDLRQVFDAAAQHTGQRSADAIVGGLNAIARDAAKSGTLKKELGDVKAKADVEERWSLARRLVKSEAVARTKVFEDVFVKGDDGKPTDVRALDDMGKPVIRLRPMYAEMRLGTLRGEVEASERAAQPRSPFEPDRDAAETANEEAKRAMGGAGDVPKRVERAKGAAAVVAAFNRPGNEMPLEKLAAAHVAAGLDLMTNGAIQ